MVSQSAVQGIDLGLRLLRLLLIVTALLAAWSAWHLPSDDPEPTPAVVTEKLEVDPDTAPSLPDLAWYAPLWERDLKQTPYPPSKTKPSEQPQRPIAPVPELLATLVDGDLRLAHFRNGEGRVRLQRPDDTIGGYRLKAIKPGRVRLERAGREVWVHVPKRRE